MKSLKHRYLLLKQNTERSNVVGLFGNKEQAVQAAICSGSRQTSYMHIYAIIQ